MTCLEFEPTIQLQPINFTLFHDNSGEISLETKLSKSQLLENTDSYAYNTLKLNEMQTKRNYAPLIKELRLVTWGITGSINVPPVDSAPNISTN
jgi:hypothetical protein